MGTISTAALRKLLQEQFDDEELRIFCFDHYEAVYQRFADGMTKTQKIQLLLEHCRKNNQLDALHSAILEQRPHLAPPPPPAPKPPPAAPAIVRAAPVNPLFPVTIAEWQDELAQRNEHFGQPDGYWCYVRPGRYLIGGWKNGDPVDTLELPAFWIAKYPVTVQQYRQFINAGGYANDKLWTPNGWKWKEIKKRQSPYYWPDTNTHDRLNVQDNQPVVTITWYEAVAFARWLTARLSLPPGYEVRLPTEAEWEAAAAYDTNGQRHPYPWGEQEPTRELADFDKDRKTDKPAPVGKRPAGAAACGAHNLAGSVWESCSSDYTHYAARAAVVVDDFALDGYHAPVRGGHGGVIERMFDVRRGSDSSPTPTTSSSTSTAVVSSPPLAIPEQCSGYPPFLASLRF